MFVWYVCACMYVVHMWGVGVCVCGICVVCRCIVHVAGGVGGLVCDVYVLLCMYVFVCLSTHPSMGI